MKYFFDTEFIEKPCTIDLISIGMVCEDGREFYAESSEVEWSQADQWVLDNVKVHLQLGGLDYPNGGLTSEGLTLYRGPKTKIAQAILNWIGPYVPGPIPDGGTGKPEFWAYYADYDWVAFCWLFGRVIDLPNGWPMFCMDLKQWNVQLGERQLPKQEGMEHHALADARWLKGAWEWMDEYLASGDW